MAFFVTPLEVSSAAVIIALFALGTAIFSARYGAKTFARAGAKVHFQVDTEMQVGVEETSHRMLAITLINSGLAEVDLISLPIYFRNSKKQKVMHQQQGIVQYPKRELVEFPIRLKGNSLTKLLYHTNSLPIIANKARFGRIKRAKYYVEAHLANGSYERQQFYPGLWPKLDGTEPHK